VELIGDGEKWLEGLQNRNLTAHTYDEKIANKVVGNIRNTYFPELKSLYELLKKRK